jgi:hypothetical protein
MVEQILWMWTGHLSLSRDYSRPWNCHDNDKVDSFHSYKLLFSLTDSTHLLKIGCLAQPPHSPAQTVRGSCMPIIRCRGASECRVICTSMFWKSLTQLNVSTSHGCIRWELGACWLQHLRTQAGAEKEAAEVKVKAGLMVLQLWARKHLKLHHYLILQSYIILPRIQVRTSHMFPNSGVPVWLCFLCWIGHSYFWFIT